MTWYLLRHAEKEYGDYHNPLLRHQDEPLSAQGWRSAAAWVPYFAERALTAIYVSRYQRTAQTAAAIAARLRLTPSVDARLDELDNGLVDTMTEAQFQQAYPDVWQAYAARQADFQFPGGESGAAATARIASFMAERQRQHTNENLLIVCHDGLIRLWLCYLFGLPVYRRGDFKTDFAGLTEFSFQADVGRWRLHRFNQPCPA